MRRLTQTPFVTVFLFLIFYAAPTTAWSGPERRIALVVTNQNHAAELMPLQFPNSDGRIVAAALIDLGFDVRILNDSSIAEFREALTDFVQEVEAAGPDAVALFYFSGHCWPRLGDQTNWIILNEKLPSAKRILANDSVRTLKETTDGRWERFRAEIENSMPKIGVPLAAVTKRIAVLPTKATFVVIDSHLDVAEPAIVDESSRLSKLKNGNGFMFVAQGRPGLGAADSNDFSNSLASALLTPGIDAQNVFKQVQVRVAEKTNGRQIPWIEDRLLNTFQFIPSQPGAPTVIPTSTTPSAADRTQVERSLWNAIQDSTEPAFFRTYLERFPEGENAGAAKQRLEKLTARPPADPTRKLLRRAALVIGNANYKTYDVLRNTQNDAKAMASAFRDVGFSDVVEKYDLDRAGFVDALKAFGEAAKDADWAVLYYAGHGMEIGGRNYFLPTDAKLHNESDVEDEAVPVTRLFERLADSNSINVIILDACRENPFAKAAAATRGTREKIGGLAQIEAKTGTLIALAADPGQLAIDGEPGALNSPYAAALLKHIREPKIDVRIMFGRVYDTMIETMRGQQQPWIQAKLGGQQLYINPD